MHLGRDFEAQAVQADEAGGVVLVVGLGRVGFHRGGSELMQTPNAREVGEFSDNLPWRF